MSGFKLKSISEVAEEVTLKRYVDLDIDYHTAYIIDPNTKDNIALDWFIEHLEEDFKKHLEEHEKWLRDEEDDPNAGKYYGDI